MNHVKKKRMNREENKEKIKKEMERNKEGLKIYVDLGEKENRFENCSNLGKR